MVGRITVLFRTWFVLSAFPGAELRINQGLIEDTGDPANDVVASYLEYEEPQYNQKNGYTADDFTDNLVGYQTQATKGRSFGWETSGFGEIPFAALLVSHRKDRYCMGTVVTDRAVVTPCACVRTMGFRDSAKTDFEIQGNAKGHLYEYDIGSDVDVVADHVEYVPDHVGRGIYPHVTQVVADKCFEIWSTIYVEEVGGGLGFDYTKSYRQLFYPAIVQLSGVLGFEAPCPWPPYQVDYTTESSFTIGNTAYSYFFNPETDHDPEPGLISSYKFLPYEDRDLSMDNDGRSSIRTDYRLVNLRVALCDQKLCNSSDVFRRMNKILYFGERLNDMLCWCDVPWVGDEQIYQNMRNPDSPVYFKSVHGGIVGAPVVSNGEWVAWIVEPVSREISKFTQRPTWSRGVDDETIKFLEEKIPYLKTAFRPKINDVNRLSFAIHDLKEFVPDADLKREDLDLQAWAQVGNPRIIRPKTENQLRRADSRAPSIMSTLALSHFVTFFFILSLN